MNLPLSSKIIARLGENWQTKSLQRKRAQGESKAARSPVSGRNERQQSVLLMKAAHGKLIPEGAASCSTHGGNPGESSYSLRLVRNADTASCRKGLGENFGCRMPVNGIMLKDVGLTADPRRPLAMAEFFLAITLPKEFEAEVERQRRRFAAPKTAPPHNTHSSPSLGLGPA